MKPKRRLTIPAISIPLWWPDMPKNLRSWLPSRGNVLFTTTMILMLVWAQTAGAFPSLDTSAASTNTIAYQGRLADSGGNPLTTTVNMTFRLYNAATGGSPLWSENWTGSNGVQVSDGLFNVMLGSLTAIPQSVISGNPTLFLGITAGTDDEMAPRVQLGSVPFAIQALTVSDGSVTTTKIEDGAITQRKLSSEIQLMPGPGTITTAMVAPNTMSSSVVRHMRPSSSLGTNSTSFVPLPNGGLSLAINTSGGDSTLVVTFNGSAFLNQTDGAGALEIRLVLDGIKYGPDLNGFRYYFNEKLSHRAFSWNWHFANVEAGSHTVEVQWRSVSNADWIYIDNNDDLTLTVMELKR